MSTATLPPWNIDDPPPLPVRRFTVAEYERLAEIGVLTPDDRVELLEGWIVPKMAHNPLHDGTIQIIVNALRPFLSPGWCDRVQSATSLPDSAPEPDIVIARGNERSFIQRHPQPSDIGLIIEVTDSSLGRDRGTKARLYARAGIPAYWIVNLIDRQIEVHTDPSGPADEPEYRQIEVFAAQDEVAVALDGHELGRLRVSTILP